MRCIFTLSKIWKKYFFFVFVCFLCDSRVEMTRKYSQNFLIANCCPIGLLAQKESDSNSLFRPKTHQFTAFGGYLGFGPHRTDPVACLSMLYRYWMTTFCQSKFKSELNCTTQHIYTTTTIHVSAVSHITAYTSHLITAVQLVTQQTHRHFKITMYIFRTPEPLLRTRAPHTRLTAMY